MSSNFYSISWYEVWFPQVQLAQLGHNVRLCLAGIIPYHSSETNIRCIRVKLVGVNVSYDWGIIKRLGKKNLLRDIFIAGSTEEGTCQQKHICSSLAQRPKPVVILH